MKIPATAEYYPNSPAWPEYLQNVIDAHKRIIASVNNSNLDNFNRACGIWTTGNLRNRDMGLALTPKPISQPVIVVHVLDVAGKVEPEEGATTIEVSAPALAGTGAGTYMWDEQIPGPKCDDLPPAAPVQTGTSLMQQFVDQRPATGDPTIPVVGVTKVSTSSNGMIWVRVA